LNTARRSLAASLLFAALIISVAATRAANGTATRSNSLITEQINENNLVTLAGNTRPEANTRNDRGAVYDSFPLNHIWLLMRRPAHRQKALDKLARDQMDKKSPNFHKWIGADQIGEQYGPSKADQKKVTDWLKAHGFKVNLVYKNQVLIDFGGTAGQVRDTFHTEIHNLQVRGKTYFANMSDPKIPAALAPAVVGIVSLNNFRPHTPLHSAYPEYTPSGEGLGFQGGQAYLLVPEDIQNIYELVGPLDNGATGTGQTIAVLEDSDAYNSSDWNTFRSEFGLSSYSSGSLSTIHPSPTGGDTCNGSGCNCNDPSSNSNESEAILDAEWASAAAPNATIDLAACSDSGTAFGGFIAMQNLLNGGNPPAIMSISYAESEEKLGATYNAFIDTLYQQAWTAGVAVFVSAGDVGAAMSDDASTLPNYASDGITVNGFASTPYDVAVGGTDFRDGYQGNETTYWNSTNDSNYGSVKSGVFYIPEIPWNDSCGSELIAKILTGSTKTYSSTGLCNLSENTAPWNLHTIVAGGGGPSECATGTPSTSGVKSGTCAGYAKPSWQSIVGNPSDGVRDIPDVSLFSGDGIWSHAYVYCDTGSTSCSGAPYTWSLGGGTSFSAPIMAGMHALVNSYYGNQGNPVQVYYEIASSEYGSSGLSSCYSVNVAVSADGCAFQDITDGDSDVPCEGSNNCYLPSGTYGVLSTSNSSYAPAYGAGVGWDFSTGIGSPNATTLFLDFDSHLRTPTATATATRSPTVTRTASPTVTTTRTATPSPTATRTPTATVTATRTATPSPTATVTATATRSPTATVSPTATLSPTGTVSPTATTTATATRSPTMTRTMTPTATVTATVTQTPTATTTVTATTTTTPTPIWPTFHHDIQRTGLSSFNTSSNTGATNWTATTSGEVESSPALSINGNTVYAASDDGYLYAYSTSNGSQLWKFQINSTTGISETSSPAVSINGTIYVGTQNDNLYAINSGGSEKWVYTTGGEISSSPIIGSDGTIYFGSGDGNLYALTDGGQGTVSEKWAYNIGNVVDSSPTISNDGGTIYVGTDTGSLFAINTSSGTKKWQKALDTQGITAVAVGSNGRIYYNSYNDNFIYAVTDNGTSATVDWSVSAPSTDSSFSTTAIGPSGTIYFASNGGALSAITDNGSSGTLNWTFQTSDSSDSSPAVGSDGTIFIGTNSGYVYAVTDNGSSATQKWVVATGSSVNSSPAIGSDGTVYIGSQNDKLYAINTGPVATPTATRTTTTTPSPTLTRTSTPTTTATPTVTLTVTLTTTTTASPTLTATDTATQSATPTFMATATITRTTTATATGTFGGGTRTASATFSPTLTVTATASATKTFTATATFTATSIATRTATMTATPTSIPTTSVSVGPSSCDSGSVVEGNTSTSCVLTLNNTGFTNHAIISSIAIDDTLDFGVFFTDCQSPGGIPAQSSCSINVSFTPQSTGSFTTQMHVYDNASSSPQSVTLTGTGSLPPSTSDTIAPNPLDFGGSPVTVANEQFITVNNTGFTNPLVLQTLTLDDTTSGYTGPNEFALVPADSSCPTEPAGLGPQASCIIAIDLTADASHVDASITGTLVITGNATTSPQTINLTGYGVSGITSDGDCYTTATGACDATQSDSGFSGQSCLIDSGTCTTGVGPNCTCQ